MKCLLNIAIDKRPFFFFTNKNSKFINSFAWDARILNSLTKQKKPVLNKRAFHNQGQLCGLGDLNHKIIRLKLNLCYSNCKINNL